MSIGEALAQARREAGLSITEVSRRTRIRAAIISGIEHDDYSGCGGDFYARGHIRAIAHVAGIDPGPLIGEYDAARGALEPVTAAEAFEPVTPLMRRRGWAGWAAVLGLVFLVATGLAVYLLVSADGHPTRAAAVAAAHRAGRHPAVRPTPQPPASHPTPSPAIASFALDGDPAAPWHSDWYTTAFFGTCRAARGCS